MDEFKQKITSEEEYLISKIENALKTSIKAEIGILKNGRTERTFTSYLAFEIGKQIDRDNIRCDPFYDKHLGATKYLDGKRIELDVAIHERNTDSNNLVAIEIETTNNPAEDDVWKIEKLTQELYGYGYKLGLYVVLGVAEKAGNIITLVWYKEGRPL